MKRWLTIIISAILISLFLSGLYLASKKRLVIDNPSKPYMANSHVQGKA